MSSEHLEIEDINTKEEQKTNRVDINHLLHRVRQNQKKANKESLIFFSLIGSLILIVGVIVSL